MSSIAQRNSPVDTHISLCVHAASTACTAQAARRHRYLGINYILRFFPPRTVRFQPNIAECLRFAFVDPFLSNVFLPFNSDSYRLCMHREHSSSVPARQTVGIDHLSVRHTHSTNDFCRSPRHLFVGRVLHTEHIYYEITRSLQQAETPDAPQLAAPIFFAMKRARHTPRLRPHAADPRQAKERGGLWPAVEKWVAQLQIVCITSCLCTSVVCRHVVT